MATRFEATRQTKASISKVFEHFSHPENIPKVHPDFAKGVKILAAEGDTITFEQDAAMLGRKLHSVNKLVLNRPGKALAIDTLEGDGRGSRIAMSFNETPEGTELRYVADMELGPLGFFAKGPARSTFERAADEGVKVLDSM
jgi:hypothetical protein